MRSHPREAALLPEAPTVITLTFPHRSLSPLLTLTEGGGGVQEIEEQQINLRPLHWHSRQHFGNGDRHGEQGQGGGAPKGIGQGQGCGVALRGEAHLEPDHGRRRAGAAPQQQAPEHQPLT